MPAAYDLTGQTFGRLVVKEKAGSMNGRVYWYCECQCGTWTLTPGSHLKRSRRPTRSCGCLQRDNRLKAMMGNTFGEIHGGCHTSEHMTWRQMKQTQPYVEAWEDFNVFINDVGKRPSPKHRLTRKDKRQPHSKENTYWENTYATIREERELGLPMDLAI